MASFFSYLFPYKKYTYELKGDAGYFISRLDNLVKEMNDKYLPGRHYLFHDHQKKEFAFRRKPLNPGGGSGGLFRYKYSFENNRTYIFCRMGYSPFLYVLFIFACIITFMFAYLPVNLFFQMEAFIVRDDFEIYFKEDILKRT